MISIDMATMVNYSQGNPGALAFLVDLVKHPNSYASAQILETIKEYESLRGTNLYVLYSDLCNKDIEKVSDVLFLCPQDVVEDACSRQDYSGRELINKYVKWQA